MLMFGKDLQLVHEVLEKAAPAHDLSVAVIDGVALHAHVGTRYHLGARGDRYHLVVVAVLSACQDNTCKNLPFCHVRVLCRQLQELVPNQPAMERLVTMWHGSHYVAC